MAFSTTYENDLALYIFQNTALPTITTNLYVSLHTADPSSGNQTTSEATYTSYARVSVVQSSSGWTVSTNNAVNLNAITFPQCTGGSNTITNVGIGTATSGAGVLILAGALTASLSVSNLIQPQFAASALSITFT